MCDEAPNDYPLKDYEKKEREKPKSTTYSVWKKSVNKVLVVAREYK